MTSGRVRLWLSLQLNPGCSQHISSISKQRNQKRKDMGEKSIRRVPEMTLMRRCGLICESGRTQSFSCLSCHCHKMSDKQLREKGLALAQSLSAQTLVAESIRLKVAPWQQEQRGLEVSWTVNPKAPPTSSYTPPPKSSSSPQTAAPCQLGTHILKPCLAPRHEGFQCSRRDKA